MATLRLGKEPGVYIQEEVNPELAITDAQLKVAGLVGHAAPTLTVMDLNMQRGEGSTDTLPYPTGIVQSVLCISYLSNAYGTNLPQYVQLTATEPTDPRPAEEPVSPGPEPTIADYAQDPEHPTAEEEAAYEAALEQWQEDVEAYNAAMVIWNEWVAYDAAVAAADYSVSDNVITWLHPIEEQYYFVTLIVKKTEDHYLPKQFVDIDAVKEFYGPEVYELNGEEVVSEITVGARLMFDNGADIIWICEAEPGDNNQPSVANVKKAITLLDDIEIQSLVVLYQNEEIQQFIKQRVVIDSATENQHERVGFCCALSDEVAAIKEQCIGFKEQRIVNIVPSKVTILSENMDGVGTQYEVQSTFAAAAAVGQLINNTRLVSEPLTRKTLVGIYSPSKIYNRQEIETMSAAGAFILKDNTANPVIVNQSVTTDNTNQNNRELSVVLIKDEVMKNIRTTLDSTYIGRAYNRKTTPTMIKTTIMGILNSYVDTLIEGYDESDIVVTPDTIDTTRVNVKMRFAVLRPLNYIYISFMVTL